MKKLCLILVLCLLVSVAEADILVSKDGENSSFTKAVYDTVDTGETIIVFPGTYNIKEEYEALFGDVSDLRYDVDIGNSFQLGIMLHDRKIVFMPGAKLVCVWDQPADGQHLFCPLYVHHNVSLHGLDLYAEGMLYAIHDDVWNYDEPYINEYHNCRIVARLLKNTNCIGGGCGKYSRHIISNCYFDNGVDNITVRYHNNTFPNSEGDIWISNSYFNGALALCYMGDNTNKLNVYVDGCKAMSVETKYETSDSAENIYLYKWNNTN